MILEFIQSDLSPFTKYNRMSKGTETNNGEKQKKETTMADFMQSNVTKSAAL
jgi:hypothetical protein